MFCEHEWDNCKCLKCGQLPQNADDLVEISDKNWELGTLEEIKEALSPELFTVHVGMNIIGNFQGDGWHSIFTDQSELLPYVSDALTNLGLMEINTAFQEVLSQFPELIRDDESEVPGFLEGAGWEMTDDELSRFSEEDRSKISAYNNLLEKLDDTSDAYFGLEAPAEGWKSILDYIRSIY